MSSLLSSIGRFFSRSETNNNNTNRRTTNTGRNTNNNNQYQYQPNSAPNLNPAPSHRSVPLARTARFPVAEPDLVLQLQDMGFTQGEANYALQTHNNDTETAVLHLISFDEKKPELQRLIAQHEHNKIQGNINNAPNNMQVRWIPSAEQANSNLVSTFLELISPLNNVQLPAPLRRPLTQPKQSHPVAAPPKIVQSHRKFAPPRPKPGFSSTEDWVCSSCTAINAPSATEERCSVCNSERPLTLEQQDYIRQLRECGICFSALPLENMHRPKLNGERKSQIQTHNIPIDLTAENSDDASNINMIQTDSKMNNNYHSTNNTAEISELSCDHLFCLECFHEYLNKKTLEGQVLSIRCPAVNCPRQISAAEVEGILDGPMFIKYQQFKQNAEVQADPSARYCYNRMCQAILRGSKLNPHLICPDCGHSQCFSCLVDWHEGVNCYQYQQQQIQRQIAEKQQRGNADRANDEAFLALMRRDKGKFQQCNRCGNFVELASGCKKLTCRCGNQQCFQCGSQGARCACTSIYHVFYPVQEVLSNWNGRGPG
jgi:hypothetical protein